MRQFEKCLFKEKTDHRNRCHAFTMVEVIIVLVIIGITTLIALPSFKSFTRSSSVTSAVNDLVSALNVARSEAVTRQVNVTVCKSNDQTSCDTSGVGWEQGWIVFIDIDAAGDVDGGTDTILRVYDPPKGGVSMIGNAHVLNRLTYTNSGFFSALFNGTITVTLGTRSIEIITSNNGRVRTNKL